MGKQGKIKIISSMLMKEQRTGRACHSKGVQGCRIQYKIRILLGRVTWKMGVRVMPRSKASN
jgi:hypothetical protein